MKNNEIKQKRKPIFQQMKMAEERLESASFILEREGNVDAIPILFKAVDITVRTLLSFKQKPLGDFQKNIKSLEEHKEEGLYDEETAEFFNSLNEMNEEYKSEIEVKYSDSALKSIFEKTESFLAKTEKFLKAQLTTSKERIIKRRVKKILVATGTLCGSLIIIFILFRLGTNIFGPKHGLLAYYYNNINLEEPAAVKRIDKKIDFQWAASTPHPKIESEFSVRWEGRIKIDKDDKYLFIVMSDEGIRLFLDDEIILDTWLNDNREMRNVGGLYLKKGFHKIGLEYYFNQRHADIKLLWRSPSFDRRVVGKKVLFPPLEYKEKLSE